jgi:hypothetical protein
VIRSTLPKGFKRLAIGAPFAQRDLGIAWIGPTLTAGAGDTGGFTGDGCGAATVVGNP